jgi:hypothetical protein
VLLKQRRECDLRRFPTPACKLLEELTIRQARYHSHVEQCLEVALDGLAPFVWHRSGPR